MGQTVALKFLPDEAARDPGRLARFPNEVRIARQVTHPNVCRVYDIGEVDGLPVLSMEFVDGEDLASLPGSRCLEDCWTVNRLGGGQAPGPQPGPQPPPGRLSLPLVFWGIVDPGTRRSTYL